MDYVCVIRNQSIVWIVLRVAFQQTPRIINTYRFAKSNVMGCFKVPNEKGEVAVVVPLPIAVERIVPVVGVLLVVDGHVQTAMQTYHDHGSFVLVVETNVPIKINIQLCLRTPMMLDQLHP